MQATLVSHYGPKSESFAAYVKRLQDELAAELPDIFHPYALEQIHGTIIGLEGSRQDGRVVNANYLERRGEVRHMDPARLLAFLCSLDLPSFAIRVGGFDESADHGFLSRGQHPFLRSFSIQGGIAVAMGWPGNGVLADLRRSFLPLNVLHKWHRTEADRDNDFFFVLGRIDRALIATSAIEAAERRIRRIMADIPPILITIDRTSLRLVQYIDPQLPLDSSRAYRLDDPELTPERLLSLYRRSDTESANDHKE